VYLRDNFLINGIFNYIEGVILEDNYENEWIACIKGEIITHDKNIKKAYNKAKQIYPAKRICLEFIPDNKNHIY